MLLDGIKLAVLEQLADGVEMFNYFASETNDIIGQFRAN
jgi:hypothetical protein